MALNVETISSFCLHHFIENVKHFMLSIHFAFSDGHFYVSFGSRVIPRIFRCFVVGSVFDCLI